MTTALLLDIDGTLIPHTRFTPFGDPANVGTQDHPQWVSQRLCLGLGRLGTRPQVHPAWLTSKTPSERRRLNAPFPGQQWDQIPPDPAPARLTWTKWAALTLWLDTHPKITRLAWVDDDLGPCTTVPHNSPDQIRRYHSALTARLDDVLVLTPIAEYGMTPHHLDLLSGWLTTSGE
jgi:hypothetical protein